MGDRTTMRTAMATLALASAVVGACGGGDDDDTQAGSAGDLGGAIGAAADDTPTTASNQGSVSVETTTTTEGADTRPLPELAPPDIPGDSSPPTTAPDTEPAEWPVDIFTGETIPLFGDVVVDLEPEGYTDFPVYLEEGARMAVMSGGDDGIMTHIEVWRPDGAVEGSWRGGEPGVINGWEWIAAEDLVPLTGTWVFRVVHLGGSDEPFLLRFFRG